MSELGLAPSGYLRTFWCGSKSTDPAHKTADLFIWGQEGGMLHKEDHEATLIKVKRTDKRSNRPSLPEVTGREGNESLT